jgi:two-component system invasion response regulator UvrY
LLGFDFDYNLSRMKILLADDHSFIRLGLVQILKDEFQDVSITEVSDGVALLKEVMKGSWDLVISDLDMPGRGGLEALEQIKQMRPLLPVLILSIFPEDLYAIRVLKAGAAGYLNKKAAPNELVAAVQKILTGRKYITPDIAEKLLLYQVVPQKPHEQLSNRELEVFKLLAEGKTISQIAEILSLATTTISSHRSKILEKLHVATNSDITRYAISNGILADV